jgi:3',5'-cyclic AMP phosphodiesterase CpdA
MKRRDFLRNASLAFAAAGTVSANASALASSSPSAAKSAKIRFGIISDLHHDFTFDAPQRLQAFINAMNQRKPDFILDLGDFCCPVENNRVITDIWNGFSGPKFHVIGNHETDQHCTREQVVNFWGMAGRYYSFDRNGFHFIVLDANAPNPANPKEHYPSGIEDEQLLWLKTDLANTKLPTFVFSHQGLDFSPLRNREDIRILLENTQSRNGNGKVIAAFSGHTHKDYYNLINGIHYIQINSSTYRWWGDIINNDSFGQEAEKAHPLIFLSRSLMGFCRGE